MFSRVDRMSVRDRQTDGQSRRSDRYLAYAYTSRGKNRDFRQIYRFSSEMTQNNSYETDANRNL